MISLKTQKLGLTHILMGLNVLYFIIMFLSDPTLSNQTLVNFGAKFNPYIQGGEYWRLLSAAFIHSGITHLFFNTLSLFIIGPSLEMLFGKWRFISIYLLSAILSTAVSYHFSPHISIGASGAVFGLLGTHIYLFIRNRKGYLHIFGKDFLALLVLNLFIGFTMPGIDNFGHVGGLIGGALIASTVGLKKDRSIGLINIAAFGLYAVLINSML